MIYDFQKASITKRISAFLIDFVVTLILGTFFAFLVSLITNYSGLVEQFKGYYSQYELIYNISLTDVELFNAFTEEELARYNEAITAMNNDPEVLRCWGLVSTLPILMLSVAVVLSTLITEFILPLIFKNGQTLGKKIFGIGVINTNCVKATNFQLFVRAMLGKCTIEYMIPGIILIMMISGTIGIIGPLILFAILVIQMVLFFSKPERPLIHDVMSVTACCNISTQKIFISYKEMIEYKKEQNKLEVNEFGK